MASDQIPHAVCWPLVLSVLFVGPRGSNAFNDGTFFTIVSEPTEPTLVANCSWAHGVRTRCNHNPILPTMYETPDFTRRWNTPVGFLMFTPEGLKAFWYAGTDVIVPKTHLPPGGAIAHIWLLITFFYAEWTHLLLSQNASGRIYIVEVTTENVVASSAVDFEPTADIACLQRAYAHAQNKDVTALCQPGIKNQSGAVQAAFNAGVQAPDMKLIPLDLPQGRHFFMKKQFFSLDAPEVQTTPVQNPVQLMALWICDEASWQVCITAPTFL